MSDNLTFFTASQRSVKDLMISGAELLQGRYCPLKLIGQGGFGKTFLAVDELQPQRYCVIKQLLPMAQPFSQRQQSTLHQEGLRLVELGKHPQVPTLLDVFEQDDQGYLVQEFIDGQTLEQELAESGSFSPSQIRELLNQLLPVLRFIHDRQIIHRDIKPANIIRRRNGQLVLVDFGAAKSYSEDQPIQTGTLIGTAEYAAPEQIRGKAVFASDLYSLGVTCVRLLTQMPPFDLFDDGEDIWRWQDFLPSPIDSSLAHILSRLLCPKVNLRYHSAAEVLEDLNRLPIVSPLSESEDREIPINQLAREDMRSLDLFSTGYRPTFSATVFVPLTQEWYRIPATNAAIANKSKKCSNLTLWLLNSMMISATAAAITIIVLALEPHFLTAPFVAPSKAKNLHSAQKIERSAQKIERLKSTFV